MRETAYRKLHGSAATPKLDAPVRVGGYRPTLVRYMDTSCEFGTSKEAYIWMLEKLLSRDLHFFERCRSSWLMRYFAKDPRDLTLAEATDHNASHRLTNGWYANVAVPTGQKFELLLGLACMMGYRSPNDWDWVDQRGSVEIVKRRERVRRNPPSPSDYEEDDELGFEGLAESRRQAAIRRQRKRT